MPWQLLRLARNCGSCGNQIQIGAPAYITKAGWAICDVDAKRMFDETVPSDLPELGQLPCAVVPGGTGEFALFDRKVVAASVRRNILDARQRQSGERREDEETRP